MCEQSEAGWSACEAVREDGVEPTSGQQDRKGLM